MGQRALDPLAIGPLFGVAFIRAFGGPAPAPPARLHDEGGQWDPWTLDTGETPLTLTPVGVLGSAVSTGGAKQGITSQGRSSRPTGRGTTKSVEAGR